MKVCFISIGKRNEPIFDDAIAEYTRRIARYADVEWKIITHSSQKEEGEALLRVLKDGDFLILLDERGKQRTSQELANLIEERMNNSQKRVIFAIGGAYGWSDAVRTRADTLISISSLTFPHQLMRVILAEQLYRAFTILRGEKYHHS